MLDASAAEMFALTTTPTQHACWAGPDQERERERTLCRFDRNGVQGYWALRARNVTKRARDNAERADQLL